MSLEKKNLEKNSESNAIEFLNDENGENFTKIESEYQSVVPDEEEAKKLEEEPQDQNISKEENNDPPIPFREDIENENESLDQKRETELKNEQPNQQNYSSFGGFNFPKLCDVNDQVRSGNFLPLILLLEKHPEVDVRIPDNTGYCPVHYAVCFGNLQVNIYY